MNQELFAMLHLAFYQAIAILIFAGGERIIFKNKNTAKKIAERLGLIFLGVIESTFVIFLCWLFG